ncbi:DUF6969 family protein [Futiania mangrovi]|uniref:DUF6969 domain-containing protein n=1 Tax=Futiania mangrovi TaxID=2959716 RepID=A0A9J6PI41_9PROT|nr:hypothetical protein [Futiania mangrovii]MCP1336239.1 hypothetical protein [Futiania mangrovii]
MSAKEDGNSLMPSTNPRTTAVDDAQTIAALPDDALAAMAAAADEVEAMERALARAGRNPVGQVLAGQGTFYEMNHYPDGDVYDDESHAQYYYHAHRTGTAEHGHFHTFLRAKGMEAHMSPAPYEGSWPRPLGDDAIAHLVAVSMDKAGAPIGLFTTNRWVTGETFYGAQDVISMLDSFEVGHASPCLATNRWLTALLRLYRPDIARLVRARDAQIRLWALRHPGEDVFEDRDLEIASEQAISVPERIAAVRVEAARRGI